MKVNPLLSNSVLLPAHPLSLNRRNKRDSVNLYPSLKPFHDEDVDLLGPLLKLPVLGQEMVVLRRKIVVPRQTTVFIRFFYCLSTVTSSSGLCEN